MSACVPGCLSFQSFQFWSASAERSGDGALDYFRNGIESGIALRLPPPSKLEQNGTPIDIDRLAINAAAFLGSQQQGQRRDFFRGHQPVLRARPLKRSQCIVG